MLLRKINFTECYYNSRLFRKLAFRNEMNLSAQLYNEPSQNIIHSEFKSLAEGLVKSQSLLGKTKSLQYNDKIFSFFCLKSEQLNSELPSSFNSLTEAVQKVNFEYEAKNYLEAFRLCSKLTPELKSHIKILSNNNSSDNMSLYYLYTFLINTNLINTGSRLYCTQVSFESTKNELLYYLGMFKQLNQANFALKTLFMLTDINHLVGNRRISIMYFKNIFKYCRSNKSMLSTDFMSTYSLKTYLLYKPLSNDFFFEQMVFSKFVRFPKFTNMNEIEKLQLKASNINVHSGSKLKSIKQFEKINDILQEIGKLSKTLKANSDKLSKSEQIGRTNLSFMEQDLTIGKYFLMKVLQRSQTADTALQEFLVSRSQVFKKGSFHYVMINNRLCFTYMNLNNLKELDHYLKILFKLQSKEGGEYFENENENEKKKFDFEIESNNIIFLIYLFMENLVAAKRSNSISESKQKFQKYDIYCKAFFGNGHYEIKFDLMVYLRDCGLEDAIMQ